MAVAPVGAQTEKADRLDAVERDLIVGQLGHAGKLAGQPTFAGALGAGAFPAKQLEVIDRIVPIRPTDGEQLARAISQDV